MTTNLVITLFIITHYVSHSLRAFGGEREKHFIDAALTACRKSYGVRDEIEIIDGLLYRFPALVLTFFFLFVSVDTFIISFLTMRY